MEFPGSCSIPDAARAVVPEESSMMPASETPGDTNVALSSELPSVLQGVGQAAWSSDISRLLDTACAESRMRSLLRSCAPTASLSREDLLRLRVVAQAMSVIIEA